MKTATTTKGYDTFGGIRDAIKTLKGFNELCQ